MIPPPRTPQQRRQGTLDRLDRVGDAFAAKAGFDPRQLTGYPYFRIHPRRLQAWREADELEGRDLMREGRWLV